MDLAVTRSQSYREDLLFVNDAETKLEVGRYDRKTGQLTILDGVRVHDVVEAMWQFLAGAVPESVRDLITEHPPSPKAGVGYTHSISAHEPPSISTGTAAHSAPRRIRRSRRIRVDKQLVTLRRDNWAVVTAVWKRSGTGIDHLVIGPAGVFAISIMYCNGAGIGENMVTIDEAPYPTPYLTASRAEAEAATRLLSEASGMQITVTPVLALVDAGEIDARESCGDILVVRGEDLARALLDLPSVYSIQEREHIHSIARHPDLWRTGV